MFEISWMCPPPQANLEEKYCTTSLIFGFFKYLFWKFILLLNTNAWELFLSAWATKRQLKYLSHRIVESLYKLVKTSDTMNFKLYVNKLAAYNSKGRNLDTNLSGPFAISAGKKVTCYINGNLQERFLPPHLAALISWLAKCVRKFFFSLLQTLSSSFNSELLRAAFVTHTILVIAIWQEKKH